MINTALTGATYDIDGGQQLLDRGYSTRSDIVPGGTFPDYELPDDTDAAEAQPDPRRGSDDPHARSWPLLPEKYTPAAPRPRRVPAEDRSRVHADRVRSRQTRITRRRSSAVSVGAQWPFLSDPGRIVQKDLDIQEYTDPEHDPMIPHTLVLKPGLVIHSIYNGYWFWGRPSADELRRVLRLLGVGGGPGPTGISAGRGCASSGTRRLLVVPRLESVEPGPPRRPCEPSHAYHHACEGIAGDERTKRQGLGQPAAFPRGAPGGEHFDRRDVLEIGNDTWAIHGVLPYDGEVPIAVFHTYDEAKHVLDDVRGPTPGREGGLEPPTSCTQSRCATTAPLPGAPSLTHRDGNGRGKTEQGRGMRPRPCQ